MINKVLILCFLFYRSSVQCHNDNGHRNMQLLNVIILCTKCKCSAPVFQLRKVKTGKTCTKSIKQTLLVLTAVHRQWWWGGGAYRPGAAVPRAAPQMYTYIYYTESKKTTAPTVNIQSKVNFHFWTTATCKVMWSRSFQVPRCVTYKLTSSQSRSRPANFPKVAQDTLKNVRATPYVRMYTNFE